VTSCPKQCQGKECGPDGCGGECGTCGPGWICSGVGVCQSAPPDCKPDCSNRECGPDGCGGQCGACGFDEVCVSGICFSEAEAADLDPDVLNSSGAYLNGDGSSDLVAQTRGQHCPAGQKMWYGKCVGNNSLPLDDPGGAVSGGCGVSPSVPTVPSNFVPLLVLLALFAVIRISFKTRTK
jgi:hypothetical protein